MKAWLRRMIVRAAPTCTLWVELWDQDALRFRFKRSWVISAREYLEAAK